VRETLRSDRGRGFPILYVPGVDGTGELLLGTAERLEREHRLVRLAYRADDEPALDTYEELARGIAALCGERGLERCLVLAESFGGAVGLQLALDFPQLVGGVLLVNSFAYFPHSMRLLFSHKLSAWVPRPLFNLGRRAFAAHALFGAGADVEALDAFQRLPGAFFDRGYRRRMGMIGRLDLRPRLGELTQPLMLVAGDRDRVVPSAQTLGAIADLVPQATLETVPGGGHLLLPLAAQPWEARIAELLARK